jgi:hypothetical protein
MSENMAAAPEFGSQLGDVIAFSQAVDAIKQHNKQFSSGKQVARVLIDHIKRQERTQDLIDAGASPEEAEETVVFVDSSELPLSEEEQMSRSIVGITNAHALESAGLALSPLRQTGTIVGSQGEQIVGEVRLQMADGSKFSNFLLSISPENIDEELRENIATVVADLIAEVTDAIKNRNHEQSFIETVVYGKGIVTGLEHVGLAESPMTKELCALYEHAQQGDVDEFIEASDIGLLKAPEEQEYGPTGWHRDATADHLSNRWQKVLDIVMKAKANPNAKELYEQLLKSAQDSLEYAQSDWNKLKTEGYGGNSNYGEGFEKVFETVALELSMIASPDEEGVND